MGWHWQDAWRVMDRVGSIVDAVVVGVAVLAASIALAVAGLVAAGPGQPRVLELTSPHSSASTPAHAAAPVAPGAARTTAP